MCTRLIGIITLMGVSAMTQALPEDCQVLSAPVTYIETNGLVCMQKVIVADEAGNQQFFKASLQWLGLENPNRFRLESVELDTISEFNSPIFTEINGLLTLPKVDIPKLFGTERYVVNLMLVPDSENTGDTLFELTKADIYNNPDYVPGRDWKPYGMLLPNERRAVDILGRSIPYAQLADAIYDFDNVTVGSWELIKSTGTNTGMDAGVYRNNDTLELVIAFRGTDTCDFPCSIKELNDLRLDVTADTAIGIGTVSDQFKDAFSFAQDIVNGNPGSKIIVTGHSLGGGLAQAVGATLGLETFAFNSSPVPNRFFDTYTITLPEEQLQDLIFVIADIHDPVSNTDETGQFYSDSQHVTGLIQFNFELREIIPSQPVDLNDLRFDRHSITKFSDNSVNLISLYQAGW